MTVDNSGLVADALLRTDPALYKSIDGANSWKNIVRMRGAQVAKFRRYEEGQHDACITDQMRKILRLDKDDGTGIRDFAINYMAIIIDKMASRLKVSEITTDNEEQDKWISWLQERFNLEVLLGICNRGAIRDADSYAMIDLEKFIGTPEPAYNGFSGIVAIFPTYGGWPKWACRIWSEAESSIDNGEESFTTIMNVKVYQPYKITNFKGSVNGQTVTPGDEEKTPWVLDYAPVVHFGNLIDNYTQYGKSELRKAIPLQDVMNRFLHSGTMAGDYGAFKVAWSKGIELKKDGIVPGDTISLMLYDESGNVIVNPTPEQIAFMNVCEVGEFGETDLSQYTNMLDNLTKHVSQVTQTPIYGVTAEGNLSGEALKQLEIGLIGKIKRYQNENMAAVRQLIQLAADIQREYDTGFGQPPKLEGISINWANPEITDVPTTVASIISVREKCPGLFDDEFYRQKLGALWGMTQSQISAEGEKAQNTTAQEFGNITGASGGVPVV